MCVCVCVGVCVFDGLCLLGESKTPHSCGQSSGHYWAFPDNAQYAQEYYRQLCRGEDREKEKETERGRAREGRQREAGLRLRWRPRRADELDLLLACVLYSLAYITVNKTFAWYATHTLAHTGTHTLA